MPTQSKGFKVKKKNKIETVLANSFAKQLLFYL